MLLMCAIVFFAYTIVTICSVTQFYLYGPVVEMAQNDSEGMPLN